MARRWQVTIDCAAPAALAAFWSDVLGYVRQPPPEGFDDWDAALAAMGVSEEDRGRADAIVDPDGSGPRIFFQQVPEGKTVKNRLHLDVAVSAGPSAPVAERKVVQEAERDRLVGLGAREIGPVEEHGGRWIVMADPEGNEFCIT